MGSSTLVQSRPQGRSAVRRSAALSWVISLYVCALVVIGLLFLSERLWHWFVLPVFLCGVVVTVDAVEWLRGRLDIFDPFGVIGAIGFHFFFLAPLLQVYWDYWMRYVIPPPDWRPWLGFMAMLNLLGLLLYRFFRNRSPDGQRGTKQRVWRIDDVLFPRILAIAIAISTILQAIVYNQFGGVGGYITAYEERFILDRFKGMGYIFTLSESLPILVVMLYACHAARKRILRSWASLFGLFLLFLGLSLLFGGLRGSRSTIVWSVFWFAGIVHVWIRPLNKKLVIAGVLFLAGFLYLYAFYKDAGVDALIMLRQGQPLWALEEQTGRTVEVLLLGDLTRSDVQAFLLYRLSSPESDYRYGLGRTYLAGAAGIIPRVIWPSRPATKVKEGTELQYGTGAYAPGVFASSRVYGLAGEAMLNFGVFGILFAFAVFGLVVGWIHRFIQGLHPEDARWLLVPFLVNFGLNILHGDSDNLAFFLIKNGLIPFMVVLLGSHRDAVFQKGEG
ncbi:MAG: hypothetical protein ACUVWZ_16685 [Anaerolineae bacterium]